MTQLLAALLLSSSAHAGYALWDGSMDPTCTSDDIESFVRVDEACASQCEDDVCVGTVDAECFADCVVATTPEDEGCGYRNSRSSYGVSDVLARNILSEFPGKDLALIHCVQSNSHECGVDVDGLMSCMSAQRSAAWWVERADQDEYADLVVERASRRCDGVAMTFDETMGLCLYDGRTGATPPPAPPVVTGGSAPPTRGKDYELQRAMCEGDRRLWDDRLKRCGAPTRTGSAAKDAEHCAALGQGYDRVTGECTTAPPMPRPGNGQDLHREEYAQGLAHVFRCGFDRSLCYEVEGVYTGQSLTETGVGWSNWERNDPWQW